MSPVSLDQVLAGIDVGYLTKTARFEKTRDPADAPRATVTALVERGKLGRKTGRGFNVYDDDDRTRTADMASLKGPH